MAMNQMAGNQMAANQAGVNQTAANQTGANQAGVNQMAASQTGANQAGVNQTAANQTGVNQTDANPGNRLCIPRTNMTQVLENTGTPGVAGVSADAGEGDIPVSEINMIGTVGGGGGNFSSPETFPQILPNNPTFTVPANPLLPEEYSEILDYNSLQYLNGIFRTQIGRFVRVQQLIGSNTTQDFDGFLIGVGINYIILQEYSNQDIRILDIYGIKQMYVYYSAVVGPLTRPARRS